MDKIKKRIEEWETVDSCPIHEWENFGDVNFIMHGGILMRESYISESDPSQQTCYDIIYLAPLDDAKDGSEGLVYTAIAGFDANDCRELFEKDRNDDVDLSSDKTVILEAVEYYGVTGACPYYMNFCPQEPTEDEYEVVKRKDAREWLIEQGVNEEWLTIEEW